MNEESMLIKGFYPKQKNPNAPDFVIGKGSINLPSLPSSCGSSRPPIRARSGSTWT